MRLRAHDTAVVELVEVVAGANRVVRMIERGPRWRRRPGEHRRGTARERGGGRRDEPPVQRGQEASEGSGVGESVAQSEKAVPRVDRWMVDQDDRNSSRHFRVLEDRAQGLELCMTQVAGGDEGRPRNGTRQPDDGRRSPQPDERVGARGNPDAELRKVAPHEGTEVTLEPAFATDRRKIEVVVTGNDADVAGVPRGRRGGAGLRDIPLRGPGSSRRR